MLISYSICLLLNDDFSIFVNWRVLWKIWKPTTRVIWIFLSIGIVSIFSDKWWDFALIFVVILQFFTVDRVWLASQSFPLKKRLQLNLLWETDPLGGLSWHGLLLRRRYHLLLICFPRACSSSWRLTLLDSKLLTLTYALLSVILCYFKPCAFGI